MFKNGFRVIPFLFLSYSFSIPVLAALVPVLQNLNSVFLEPSSNFATGKQKYTTIPQLFEKIKKKGFGPNGFLVVRQNTAHPIWEFKHGLPMGIETPIFIQSGPRDDTLGRLIHGRNGHAIRSTNSWLKNKIINSPLVTFDYFYDADEFDFGQGINITCLDTIHKQVVANNPKAPLILTGTCIGGKIALEFLSRYSSTNVKALILESPFLDVKKVTYNWGKNYTKWVPLLDNAAKDKLIQSTLSWYFPQWHMYENPPANITLIDPVIPIFIAHLHNDAFYSDDDIFQMVAQLRKNGANVYLLVIKDTKLSHGRLNNKKEFTQSINAFLAHYNLPHDQQFASQGKDLLAAAFANAHAQSVNDWVIIQST